jgi:hypothetical protein
METHEILIGEYEALEREFDMLRVAKMRECARLRADNRELRKQLRLALEEVDELQTLLARSYVK